MKLFSGKRVFTLLLTCFVPCINGDTNGLFKSSVCVEGGNPSNNVVENFEARSIVQCTSKCQSTDCVAVDFCKDTKQCVLYRILDGPCVSDLSTCKHYQVDRRRDSARPESCKDIYERSSTRVSGVYWIFNAAGSAIKVFCDFYDNYGYTYVSKFSVDTVTDLTKLYTDRSHVVIRHRRSDSTQKECEVRQLSIYQNDHPLTFLVSSYTGFTEPRNILMEPYLYLGFLPTSFPDQTQGYQAGGEDRDWQNCSPTTSNSYFVLFANPADLDSVGYWQTCCNEAFMSAWVDNAQIVEQSRTMPEEFFYFFEMHMGGCGGYVSLGSYSGDILGAAIGFRFDV